MALLDEERDTMKKLSFHILKDLSPRLSGPRTGRLVVPGRQPLETPNFVAVSSRGAVPHMSPDVIAAHAQIGGVHMAVEDFTERAVKSTPPVMNCPGPSPLHTFTALPSSIITCLTPRRTPAVTAPNGNTITSISLYTSTGFQVLSNSYYVKSVCTLRPDISVALADVPYGVLPGQKRMAKMGDRTQEWLSQLLDAKDGDQAVFAPVLPIDFHSQSDYLNHLADEVAAEISGLAFYDSNLLPDIPATSSLSKLPRLSIDEPSSPHQILRQISLGMDIFTIPFLNFATDAGIAFTFEFPGPTTNGDHSSAYKGGSPAPLGIDIWSSNHAASLTPLYGSCKCYACTSHHRAYIQHLLSAKEMLGWVLLQIHNHSIMSSFFNNIRNSIINGTFEEDRKEFERHYESELPEKSGQGPRARGYHFKSEGPGEPKKNRAAWGNLGGDEKLDGSPLVPDEAASELQQKGFAEKVV